MLPSIFGFFCVSEFTITNKGSRDTSYYFPFRTFQLIIETIHSYYMQFSNSQRQIHLKRIQNFTQVQQTALYIQLKQFFISSHKRLSDRTMFITQKSKGLTQHIVSTALHSLLAELNLNIQHYNTHSFWIGTATSAIQAMILDTYMQIMNHWQSNAYNYTNNTLRFPQQRQ